MINNEPITTLATALLNMHDCDESPDTPDMLDALTALRSLLDTHHFEQLCDATETCPIHICDAAICADDADPECAHLRD
jgi:hypothetical protein